MFLLSFSFYRVLCGLSLQERDARNYERVSDWHDSSVTRFLFEEYCFLMNEPATFNSKNSKCQLGQHITQKIGFRARNNRLSSFHCRL